MSYGNGEGGFSFSKHRFWILAQFLLGEKKLHHVISHGWLFIWCCTKIMRQSSCTRLICTSLLGLVLHTSLCHLWICFIRKLSVNLPLIGTYLGIISAGFLNSSHDDMKYLDCEDYLSFTTFGVKGIFPCECTQKALDSQNMLHADKPDMQLRLFFDTALCTSN